MAVYRDSRYINTPLYIMDNEFPVLGIRMRYKFNLENAVYHTVIQGQSLDTIAHMYYNNSQLGWAIMDANPKYQCELEIKAGDVLCIPPYEEVVKVCV